MRPSRRTIERLHEQAKLLGERPTTLAERYLAEGVVMHEHPGIHFVDAPMGRRAAVAGTPLEVWEIVVVIRDNDGDIAAAAEYLGADRRVVEVAAHYYGSDRPAVDDLIDRIDAFNEREERAWRAAQEAIAT